MQQIISLLDEFGRATLGYFSETGILIQLGMIGILFLPALVLSWRVDPRLEEWARGIKFVPGISGIPGMPGILRLLNGFLTRLKWLFFVILLAIAYVVTTEAAWPASNYLVYSALLLAAAWLVITVVSHVIRSRVVGRIFSLIAWVYVAAAVLGMTDEVTALLDGAGFTVGTFRLSLLGIVQAFVLLSVLTWLSLTVSNFLDRRIQAIKDLTPSQSVLIGKIMRITLIVIAVMVGMSGLGIDLTAFTVLSGAVGVGIGFGLQKVVSNFISGIIILMDQSIKPGDTVTLGETFGWIREFRARYVSVITRDGREFLIPNEDFITTEVVNWSFSDQYVRLDVPFGVAYDSDPHEVARITVKAASSVERVEERAPDEGKNHPRPPVCWLTGFGESSLDFKLRFWISDPQDGTTNIRGKVLLAVWDAFSEHGIRIPYPHREIIMQRPAQDDSEKEYS